MSNDTKYGLNNLNIGDNLIIYSYIRGSQSYGLALPESDTDHGFVYISPMEQLLGLGLNYQEQISSDKNDDCGYEIGMCKQANESVQRTLKYFDQSPSGSTPMAQALAYALSKFKYSDKDRNIILIITDGMPDSIANVQRQLQQIEHLGVELRVLSINCELAQKLFPNCVVTDASVLLDNANKVIKQLFN